MGNNEKKSLDKYFEEISKEQVLTQKEEKELSKRIKQGDAEAINKLATANLRFVVAIANQYKGNGLDIEDLISEGNIGLVNAANKYNAERHNSRLVSYATPFIRKCIENAIKEKSGIYETPGEEAAQTNKKRNIPLSIEAPLGGRENINLLSVIANPDTPLADVLLSSKTDLQEIKKSLDILDNREREVVTCFYGICRDKLTLAEIAAQLGLKRERARQIRDKAARKLSKVLKTASQKN